MARAGLWQGPGHNPPGLGMTPWWLCLQGTLQDGMVCVPGMSLAAEELFLKYLVACIMKMFSKLK